mmetsp:Transcript_16648/g.21079  ORF Transcript_16648/g.21079 Transcript_16648/m.21079 type:complete len:136 (+) Transcript_16648:2-409(+)|eukprot:CAMPEP_0203699542 /NCGR_PEP_ID=MMETSP0091-20130426/26946_1 /ASSEMBLY_ACC=CAM_ASM_001089 /TAXON_ID=426623 /ORGANISM="Chaetoceros affinis, Strain CCMP159" /LENGTH=135 /DNA_ID=CAMNT_0050572399 /DNA_START=1 /DNA_END=408 /DNA_ORIENTATION=+
MELHQIDEKTIMFRKQAQTKMDAEKASLHALNAELLIVERDRRDAASKVEQCEQEVGLMERFIEEERIKTDEEIDKIVDGFQKFENAISVEICKLNLFVEEGLISCATTTAGTTTVPSVTSASTLTANTEEKIDP